MAWTTDLLAGIAAYAAAGAVGVWKPAGPYTAGETAIVLYTVPVSPDQLIVLADYEIVPESDDGDVTVLVQARFRGAPNSPASAKDTRDRFRDRFDGLAHTAFDGTDVSQMFYLSGADLGFDENGRLELTANYEIQARHQTALRTG